MIVGVVWVVYGKGHNGSAAWRPGNEEIGPEIGGVKLRGINHNLLKSAAFPYPPFLCLFIYFVYHI